MLDGVDDPAPRAVIRTAECAGVHGLFVPERRARLTETVAKASAGALEYLPVARARHAPDRREFRSAASGLSDGRGSQHRLPGLGLDEACALLFERRRGLAAPVRERCDR